MEDKKLYVELPRFTGRNVPITEVAEAIVTGKYFSINFGR